MGVTKMPSYATVCFNFPAHSPSGGGFHCKLPSAQACPKMMHGAPKGINEERPKKGQREASPASYLSSAEAMKEGVGRHSSCSSSPAPSIQLLSLLPPLVFPFSPLSELPLRHLTRRVFLSLPTSVVERKSKIGWLQRSSAKRSWILNRFFASACLFAPMPTRFSAGVSRVGSA